MAHDHEISIAGMLRHNPLDRALDRAPLGLQPIAIAETIERREAGSRPPCSDLPCGLAALRVSAGQGGRAVVGMHQKLSTGHEAPRELRTLYPMRSSHSILARTPRVGSSKRLFYIRDAFGSEQRPIGGPGKNILKKIFGIAPLSCSLSYRILMLSHWPDGGIDRCSANSSGRCGPVMFGRNPGDAPRPGASESHMPAERPPIPNRGRDST
jgi:hypothetical protein